MRLDLLGWALRRPHEILFFALLIAGALWSFSR